MSAAKKSVSPVRRILKLLLILFLVILLAAAAYVAYVFISYHRIGSQPLVAENVPEALAEGDRFTLLSWNIGFGAYTKDYDFFMDGGKQSRAASPEALDENMKRIASRIAGADADFVLLQEVDFDSTRTYHTDERVYPAEALPGYARVFAQNYDSPYLLYPLYSPHGASRSGLMTLSRFRAENAERVELPVDTGFTKILDLDRCYCKTEVPMADGGRIVLYDVHLSAYSSDGSINLRQIELLLNDMKAEYEQGAYCIAAGDFNMNLLGQRYEMPFGQKELEYTWAKPVPEDLITEKGFTLVVPYDSADPAPSCRNPDSAYHEGQMVVTVDGFIISANVKAAEAKIMAENRDQWFDYSDHNPVLLTFETVR